MSFLGANEYLLGILLSDDLYRNQPDFIINQILTLYGSFEDYLSRNSQFDHVNDSKPPHEKEDAR